MKKWQALRSLRAMILVSSLVAVAGTGAGVSRAASVRSATTLSFSIPYDSPTDINPIQGLVDRYNATHKTVQIQLLTHTSTDKIELQLASGTASDLVMFGSAADFGAQAFNGAIVDLTPFIAKHHFNLSQLVPVTVNAGRLLNGHVYALTYLEDTYEYLYNKKLFAQAGITRLPATLDQMVADGKKLTKYDSNGNITQLGWDPRDLNGHDIQILQTFKVPMFNADGTRCIIDNAQALRALRWWQGAINQLGGYEKLSRFFTAFAEGGGNTQQNSDQDPFTAGKQAISQGADYYTYKISQIAPKLDYGQFLTPAPAGGPNTTGGTTLGGNPIAISRDSKHADAAFQFLTWMLTDGQTYAAHHNMLQGNFSATPNLVSVLKQPSLQPNEHFRWFWTELLTNKNVFVDPPVANEHQFLDLLSQYISGQFVSGQMTAQQALSKIQDQENLDLARAMHNRG